MNRRRDIDHQRMDLELVRYERAGDRRVRALMLSGHERNARGEVLRARIVGIQVRGGGLDVPLLFDSLRIRRTLDAREINRFRRTGYLGGRTSIAHPNRICSCLGIGQEELRSWAARHGNDLAAIGAATGLGSVCGACLSRAADVIERPKSPPDSAQKTPPPHDEVRSTLIARAPRIAFDIGALHRLAAEPELHAVAAASLFAAHGERLMVRRVGEALADLEDPELAADTEVFLEQESQHVAAHDPLNRLLLDRIYPDNGFLRRCAQGMFGGVEWLPTKLGLGVSAAFEHVADAAFAAYLDGYYQRNRRHSLDSRVHALIEASGVGPLFMWHAGEEMSHRHVAFEVMRARGGGWLTRVLALLFLVAQMTMLFVPALAELQFRTRHLRRIGSSARLRFTFGLFLSVTLRGARFLMPGFHPAKEHYEFESALADDLRALPES